MGHYLVGLDEGTTGCKTCVFDLAGNLIGSDYREYSCVYFPDKPGFVEQSDAEITPALYASVKAAIAKSGVDASEIIAIGLSSQGAVIGLVDDQGQAIGNFISWQDVRGVSMFGQMEQLMTPRQFYDITGWDMHHPLNPVAKHVWLQKHEPDLYERAARFVTNQEFFLHQFGADGWFSDSSSICREGLAQADVHDYSPTIFEVFGMDPSKRGERVPHGTVVGQITPTLAELTGLPVGCAVCVGAMDQDCSSYGCGLIRQGDTTIVMGTFGACYICSDQPIRDPEDSMLMVKSHTYFEHGPNTWTIEGSSPASASSYRWFRDNLAQLEVAAGRSTGLDPYDMINAQIARSTPGANGVTFLPFLQGRAGGTVGPNAKATLAGMRMSTSRDDMARAVMEGICYEQKEVLLAQSKSGLKVGDIRLTGGAAKSPLWVQMQADIYQRPVTVLSTTENGCLGAALFAGVGTGTYKDAYEAVDNAVQMATTYEPDPKLAGPYEEAYERFEGAYQGLTSTIYA
ncbi:MAG: carbohydrate kinase [Propionibacteriaceae bacterium]|jgi:xylulokinase|nr:carbohydrate kinase [Propionibacteriaceae bacterium]